MEPIKKVDKISVRYVHTLNSDLNTDRNCIIQKYTLCAQITLLPKSKEKYCSLRHVGIR